MFSQKSLARIAQLNSLSPCYVASLKLFIDRAPECIPSFLQMLGSRREELAEALWPEQKEGVIPTCDRLTSDDLEKLLRNSPSAAEALIESCSFHPPDRSDGYNKLPERVSLGPQNALFRLLGLSQSCFQLKCFYETDAEWKEERSWHSQLTQTGQHEEEMKEIKIQLCRVPDIITPGFFSAVLGARVGDKPALFLFESLPVRAAVSFVFWKRAVWTDMLQFIFSLWGLGLLIAETWRARETNCNGMLANAVNATNQTMENPCRQQLTSVFTSSWTLDIAGKELQHERAVVADWIIAKGFVDLILEILQFAGCLFISQKGCYWNFGNFWDLFRSLLPIFLLWFYDSRLLQVLVVLTYWARLLEGATLTEKIGHALLPLQHLLRGLVPAILFTLLGFLALTHALYAVHDQDLDGEHQRLWPNSVWGTFTKLIANELDDTPLKDNMEQVLLLFGVLFFSVFMMNVFIGVINDQYSQEKKTVRLAFQSLRAQSCLTHLLRMRVVPCDLLSARAAATMRRSEKHVGALDIPMFSQSSGGLASIDQQQSLSVVAQRVPSESLQAMLGEPQEAFTRLLSRERPDGETELLASRCQDGKYEFEYFVTCESKKGPVRIHCWSSIALKRAGSDSSVLYTMTLVVPELTLSPERRLLLNQVWHSFELE
eukprot:g22623.t1